MQSKTETTMKLSYENQPETMKPNINNDEFPWFQLKHIHWMHPISWRSQRSTPSTRSTPFKMSISVDVFVCPYPFISTSSMIYPYPSSIIWSWIHAVSSREKKSIRVLCATQFQLTFSIWVHFRSTPLWGVNIDQLDHPRWVSILIQREIYYSLGLSGISATMYWMIRMTNHRIRYRSAERLKQARRTYVKYIQFHNPVGTCSADRMGR